MVTLCIYYGEKEWDGPLSLVDMLDIPDKLKFIFSDYKFNLIQMRSCNNLHFHNYDINTVFDLSSSIYNRDYEKINKLYKNQPISPELALVVGAITESQELIDHALENEKKGAINMCTALEELKKEGVQEGLQKGLQEGLQKAKLKELFKLVNYLILIKMLPLSLSWINFLCHRKQLLLILKNTGKSKSPA